MVIGLVLWRLFNEQRQLGLRRMFFCARIQGSIISFERKEKTHTKSSACEASRLGRYYQAQLRIWPLFHNRIRRRIIVRVTASSDEDKSRYLPRPIYNQPDGHFHFIPRSPPPNIIMRSSHTFAGLPSQTILDQNNRS